MLINTDTYCEVLKQKSHERTFRKHVNKLMILIYHKYYMEAKCISLVLQFLTFTKKRCEMFINN